MDCSVLIASCLLNTPRSTLYDRMKNSAFNLACRMITLLYEDLVRCVGRRLIQRCFGL
uniref:Uncharacterized protein n=1 Tax=Solanum tuberosum TaxID=4113 RepID=M1AQE2_SOLTU